MTTRLKANSIATKAQFLGCVDQIATLQTRLRLLAAKRDKQIQRVQDEYQPEISGAEEQMQSLLAQVERYAEQHREELFPGKEKSADTELASYGFRIHPPALKTLNRKWTWDAVTEAVKRSFGGRFIKTEEKLVKDSLKAELSEEQLATVGLRLESPETFGVTPKVDAAKTEIAA
jgi:phage host-nuclease inhibitor protein Gam